MSNTGVSSSDFAQILSDFSRTLSYQVVTKTTDGTGNETDTFATASNVSAVFFLEENRFIFDKQGLVEVGDAYILCATTVGIKRYDRFTISGEAFYIQNVIHRFVLGTAMLDLGVCFKV
jgi:hypothetical protein